MVTVYNIVFVDYLNESDSSDALTLSYTDHERFLADLDDFIKKGFCLETFIEGEESKNDIPNATVQEELEEIITDLVEKGHRLSISCGMTGYDISKELSDYLVKLILEGISSGK